MADKLCEYAVSEKNSKGRAFTTACHPYRNDFERDRDRIIHSEAFRRLEGKTQVFGPGLNDNFRNRLTHSIEVAQIGRTIAKNLGLNESLTDAICLGHDLGHPPFGHCGETVLNELMSDAGGFEHNIQSLRIVEFIEHPYPDFAGLNLMYETRLGLAKHTSTYDKPKDSDFDERNCSLEGQVAEIADRIAYNSHDLEDGLRARILDYDQVTQIALPGEAANLINASTIDDKVVVRTRTAKAIIDILVSNCIDQSKTKIAKANIQKIADVYASEENMIIISAAYDAKLKELEDFLMTNFYLNPKVKANSGDIKSDMEKLMNDLLSHPDRMPSYYRKLAESQGLKKTVCDYIAGMTDRFCKEYISKNL